MLRGLVRRHHDGDKDRDPAVPGHRTKEKAAERRQPRHIGPHREKERVFPMAKYLFVYRGSVPSAPPSPAEIQASFQKWGEWIGKFTQSGQMIDPGDGLQMSGKVVRLTGIVSDGPYVESKEVVGGYSIVQADDYDQAVAIARECPAVDGGGSVEIRQLAGYMDK
jgi:hypothetical protein